MMYRLKEGALSPRFGIDSPLKMCFFPLGIKEMVLWVVGHSYQVCANSSLIRRSSLLGGKLLVKE